MVVGIAGLLPWAAVPELTAAHDVAEVQAIPLSAWVVPLVCGSQDWPPLVVARIVPALPAAKHVEAVGQEIAFICCVVPPPARWVQVVPLVVATVTPCLPAA